LEKVRGISFSRVLINVNLQHELSTQNILKKHGLI